MSQHRRPGRYPRCPGIASSGRFARTIGHLTALSVLAALGLAACRSADADSADTNGSAADVQIYGPLGVGSHVDHLLVRGAVLRLWEQGYRVVLYEEIPYTMHPGQLASALAQLPLLPVGEVYILSESDFARRLRAVHCYRSQLVGVFGTFADANPMLTDYGERVGAGAGLAERFWRLGSF